MMSGCEHHTSAASKKGLMWMSNVHHILQRDSISDRQVLSQDLSMQRLGRVLDVA